MQTLGQLFEPLYIDSGTVDTQNRELNLESTQHGQSAQHRCTFSTKTSNGPLRSHLKMRHTLAYLEMLQKNGWHMQSKLLKAAFSSGYSFNTLRAVLSKPGVTISDLPPPPLPQPGDSMPIGISPCLKANLAAGLPEFSIPMLQESLVNFIVTYDEVCDYSIVLMIILISVSRQSTLLSAWHFAGSFSYSVVIFKTWISCIVWRCVNSSLQLGERVLILKQPTLTKSASCSSSNNRDDLVAPRDDGKSPRGQDWGSPGALLRVYTPFWFPL